MVYEELERLQLETWAKSIKFENGNTDRMMLQIPTHLLQYCDVQEVSLLTVQNKFSSENLLILLVWNYGLYCESLSTSSD
jgi:hypothetical protein